MPRGRPKGAKNRKTSARERAEKIAIARAELAKHAPPIDFAATYDSLDVLEKIVRHFYLRGLIEQSVGPEADWKAVDAAFVQAAAVAKDVARYRHAALSAVKLAGDLNATVMDNLSLDELLIKIKEELRKLGPLIDLEAIREPRVENRGRLDRACPPMALGSAPAPPGGGCSPSLEATSVRRAVWLSNSDAGPPVVSRRRSSSLRGPRGIHKCAVRVRPMLGIERAKRIGRTHCGQWGGRVSIGRHSLAGGRASIQGISAGRPGRTPRLTSVAAHR